MNIVGPEGLPKLKIPAKIDSCHHIIRAAYQGDVTECLDIIKGEKEALKETDPKGRTALHVAAQNNDLKLLEALVSK